MKAKPEEVTVRGTHLHYFEPHKKLIQQMMKQERKHQKHSVKGEIWIAKGREKDITDRILPKVLLARIAKKWLSLQKKLVERAKKITADG